MIEIAGGNVIQGCKPLLFPVKIYSVLRLFTGFAKAALIL